MKINIQPYSLIENTTVYRITFSDWWLTQNFVSFSYLCSLWRELPLVWLKLRTTFKWNSHAVPRFLHAGTITHTQMESSCLFFWLSKRPSALYHFTFCVAVQECSQEPIAYNPGVAATDFSLLATCPTCTLISFHTSSQRALQNLQNCLVLCWPWEHSINI